MGVHRRKWELHVVRDRGIYESYTLSWGLLPVSNNHTLNLRNHSENIIGGGCSNFGDLSEEVSRFCYSSTGQAHKNGLSKTTEHI